MKNAIISLCLVLSIAAIGIAIDATKTAAPANVGATSIQVTDGQNCFFLNGVHTCNYSATMQLASSTLCAFKSPNATSTLVWFKGLATATSTATKATLATSTSQYATSTAGTLVVDHLIGANLGDFLSYDPAGPVANNVIPPNTWIVYVAEAFGFTGFGSTAAKCEAQINY